MEYSAVGARTSLASALKDVSGDKSSSTRCRGEVDSKLVFEDGGEIDKNTKQNKTKYYEKIFTFNFCRDAGSVQRTGGGGEWNNHL